MHTQLSQHKKLMAVVMLFVFLFTQVAIAAAPPQSSPYTDPNSSTGTGGQPPVFTDNSGQAVLGTADSLSNYYFNEFKNSWGWDWLKTTNINFSAFSGGTPQWNINTFQPLTMKENLNNFLFAQGQYGTNTNTVNVGLGYRSMDANHSSMYGVNLFYDWQTTVQGEGAFTPTGSHMRVGAGLEYFTGSIETRLNGYYGVSSDIQVGGLQTSGIEAGTTAWQHVAPGADLSIGTDFSFWNAPWLKLTATGNYYQQTQSGTINGYLGNAMNANLTAQLQVTPQLSINGGGTVGNGGASSANVGFQLNLLAPPTPALFMADPVVNTLAATDISYKMLQPVQRNNAITVERYLKQAYRTVTITVTNDQGGVIPNASISLSAPTAAVGATLSATTNALGVAVIRNVPQSATPYTMTITATGYPDKTASLLVQNDVTNEPELDPAIDLYTVTFSVVDAGGNAVEGAAVAFATQGVLTDSAGLATFTSSIGNGSYVATISKDSYITKSSSVTVNGAAVQISATLIMEGSVIFTIQDSASHDLISGATVNMDGQNVLSDDNGVATFSKILLDGAQHNYYISATGYQSIADGKTPALTQNNQAVAATLIADTGTITFTKISYSDGTTEFENDQRISLMNGATVVGTPQQYASGGVTFSAVPYGTYTVQNAADGAAQTYPITTVPTPVAISATAKNYSGAGVSAQTAPDIPKADVTISAVQTALANGAVAPMTAVVMIGTDNPQRLINGSYTYQNLTIGEKYTFELVCVGANGTVIAPMSDSIEYTVQASGNQLNLDMAGKTGIINAGNITWLDGTALTSDELSSIHSTIKLENSTVTTQLPLSELKKSYYSPVGAYTMITDNQNPNVAIFDGLNPALNITANTANTDVLVIQKNNSPTLTFVIYTLYKEYWRRVDGATVTMDGVSAVSDDSGNAVIRGIAFDGKTHDYTINKLGYYEYKGSVEVKETMQQPVGATLEKAINSKALITIVDKNNQPVIPGKVTFSAGDGSYSQTKTNLTSNIVEFDNIYHVGYYSTNISGNGYNNIKDVGSITIWDSKTYSETLIAQQNPSVRISVADQNGVALIPQRVELLDSSNNVMFSASNISSATVEIPAVDPGEYYVRVTATGYVQTLTKYLPKLPQITVYTDDTSSNVGMTNAFGQLIYTMTKADGSPAYGMSFRSGGAGGLNFDEKTGQIIANIAPGHYTSYLMNRSGGYWTDDACIGSIDYDIVAGQVSEYSMHLGQLTVNAQNVDGSSADINMSINIGTAACTASGNLPLRDAVNRPIIPGTVFANINTTSGYYLNDSFNMTAGEIKTYTYRPGKFEWNVLGVNGSYDPGTTYGEVRIADNGINYATGSNYLQRTMNIQAPGGTVTVTPAFWDKKFGENFFIGGGRLLSPTMTPFSATIASGQITTNTISCGAVTLHLNYGGGGLHSYQLAMLDDNGTVIANSQMWTYMASENVTLPYCVPGHYNFQLSYNGKTAAGSVNISSGATSELSIDCTR